MITWLSQVLELRVICENLLQQKTVRNILCRRVPSVGYDSRVSTICSFHNYQCVNEVMSHQINLSAVATLMTRTWMHVGWLHVVCPLCQGSFSANLFLKGLFFKKMSPLFCNKTRFCWAFLPKSSISHRNILQMSPDHGACAHKPGRHDASELTPSRRVILFERVMVHSRVGHGRAVHMHEPTKARRHNLASVT